MTKEKARTDMQGNLWPPPILCHVNTCTHTYQEHTHKDKNKQKKMNEKQSEYITKALTKYIFQFDIYAMYFDHIHPHFFLHILSSYLFSPF